MDRVFTGIERDDEGFTFASPSRFRASRRLGNQKNPAILSGAPSSLNGFKSLSPSLSVDPVGFRGGSQRQEQRCDSAEIAVWCFYRDHPASTILRRISVCPIVVTVARPPVFVRRSISVVVASVVVACTVLVAGTNTNPEATRPCAEVEALSKGGCCKRDSCCSEKSNSLICAWSSPICT